MTSSPDPKGATDECPTCGHPMKHHIGYGCVWMVPVEDGFDRPCECPEEPDSAPVVPAEKDEAMSLEQRGVERGVLVILQSYRAAVKRGEDPPLNTLAEIIAHDARESIARDIEAAKVELLSPPADGLFWTPLLVADWGARIARNGAST